MAEFKAKSLKKCNNCTVKNYVSFRQPYSTHFGEKGTERIHYGLGGLFGAYNLFEWTAVVAGGNLYVVHQFGVGIGYSGSV